MINYAGLGVFFGLAALFAFGISLMTSSKTRTFTRCCLQTVIWGSLDPLNALGQGLAKKAKAGCQWVRDVFDAGRVLIWEMREGVMQ